MGTDTFKSRSLRSPRSNHPWVFIRVNDACYYAVYDEFVKKYPPGSDEYGKATKVCGWFESIGTLYKQELLNGELLFDWIAVKLPWSRLEKFAHGVRKKSGEPRLYENFESMTKV